MNKRGMTSKGVTQWKDFERRVARALRALDPKARRCLQFQRKHGAPDVEAGPLWVECKKKRTHVASVYRDTAKAAKARPGTLPVVVSKTGPRGPLLVSLGLGDFLKLVKGSKR